MISYSALALLSGQEQPSPKDETVVDCLTAAILACQLFTPEQKDQIKDLATTNSSSADSVVINTPPSSIVTRPSVYTPSTIYDLQTERWSPYNRIAGELGIEPHVVQAVYERLAQEQNLV